MKKLTPAMEQVLIELDKGWFISVYQRPFEVSPPREPYYVKARGTTPAPLLVEKNPALGSVHGLQARGLVEDNYDFAGLTDLGRVEVERIKYERAN